MSALVVVAHEEAAVRDAAAAVARRRGYQAVAVADGASLGTLLGLEPGPAVVIVDVALPGLLGYQVCEEVRARGLAARVILIASVYSRTAYKRKPSSLYGAFDYVEQHHVVDQLGDLLDRAVADSGAARADPSPEGDKSGLEEIRCAGEARLAFRYRDLPEAAVRAARLAEVIVADVLLYCGDEVERWREGASDTPLPPALAADLEEARRLFELRVPAEVRALRDFFGEALRAVLPRRA